MNQAVIVRQTTDAEPEWAHLEVDANTYTLTTVQLSNASDLQTRTFQTRLLSGEEFLRNLAGTLITEPATFQLKADGNHTMTVQCNPLGEAKAVHVKTEHASGVFTLSKGKKGNPDAEFVDPVSDLAILAIVVIVALAVGAVTAIVVISQGGEEAEVEVKPDPKP